MAIQADDGSKSCLSSADRERLAELETIVDEGLATFIRVGSALREIQERRLYRETHSSFDEYCRDRWGLDRHYAYRQIRAANVVQVLSDVASWQHQDRLPRNEAQARPLAPLVPEKQVEAWELALQMAGDDHPTSSVVAEAAELISGNGDGQTSVHFSSETEEWLTPPDLLRRVVEVLGGIDLDPCSDGEPGPNVPAGHHFTQSEDGLNQAWFGRVFMNPPYGQEIADWVEKLIGEFENDRVAEAVALLPARTDTAWFRSLRPYPRCFLHGRLKFSGHENSAPFPSMTVYLGGHTKRFGEAFTEVGDIYVAVDGTDRWAD